jgi:hypothetical protein
MLYADASTCQQLVSVHRWNCWGADRDTHARLPQVGRYALKVYRQTRPVGRAPACVFPAVHQYTDIAVTFPEDLSLSDISDARPLKSSRTTADPYLKAIYL